MSQSAAFRTPHATAGPHGFAKQVVYALKERKWRNRSNTGLHRHCLNPTRDLLVFSIGRTTKLRTVPNLAAADPPVRECHANCLGQTGSWTG